ncbi:MAG: amino acid adenylation domain-containing protein [Anaerolineae bacterium]|nr:amino acid adenylation domain-containing protein [Anaerolineae bacterium]
MTASFEFSDAQRALLDQLLAETDLAGNVPTIAHRSDAGPAPLSFAQERLWFLNQLGEANAAYHMTPALRLRGPLDVNALQATLAQLVARHAALRTTFPLVEGVPVQCLTEWESVPLTVHDLRAIDSAESELATRELIQTAANEPFDLATGPLFRCNLIRLRHDDNVLLLALHHICGDEWSMGILLRDLAALYAAQRNGTTAKLQGSPIEYSDYAQWQRDQVGSDAFTVDRTYWIEQLAHAPAQLALPTDRPRPAELTTRGAAADHHLSRDLLDRLQAFSREHRVTLFTTLLSAFAVLLGRYSAENDVLIGSPIANREQPEVANVVGLFLNTLVLRCGLHENTSFEELIKQVHMTVLDGFEHQAFPFEQIVEALQPQRDLGRNPLFQVLFVLQQADTLPEFGDLTVTRFPLTRTYSKFDLTLFAIPRDDGLRLLLEYNADLFDTSTMTRLLSHLETVLTGALANPQQPVMALPLLTHAERAELAAWNATNAIYPNRCLQDLFADQVSRTPEVCALLIDEREVSYRELDEQANRLAHFLQNRGVGPDIPVGVALVRSPQQIVAVLAILKAGGAVVPLDPTFPTARLSLLIEECRPLLILAQNVTVARLPDSADLIVNLDTIYLPRKSLAPTHYATPDSLAYILYTSGSTGRPKGVAMPHRPLVNLVTWQQTQSQLTVGARTLQLTSLSFDVAFQEIFSTLCFGGTLVLIADVVRREPSILLSLVAGQQIARLFLPFVALNALAEAADRQTHITPDALREVITAGEQLRITPAIGRFFSRLPNCTLTNQYGPTETHVATAHTLSHSLDHWPTLPPIGRPIANAAIHLLDAHMQPVPVGVTGELYIGGDLPARGYWNRPKLTADHFIRHPSSSMLLYKTGDLARYGADGNLHFLGRADHQVKIRGYRVEPGEIEVVLMQHDAVQSAVVRADTDTNGQARLIAYIVSAAGTQPTTTTLRDYLLAQLPEFMVPAAIVLIDALPLTPTGKIDMRQLPQPGRADVAVAVYLPPEDGLETQLAHIWEDILAVHPVGRDDNFFDLGGHSLLAIRLFAAIEERIGVRAPLAALFRAPTVGQLANVLRSQEDSADWSILVPIKPQGERPPFFCVHGIGGGVLGYAALARNIGPDQPFYGLQAVGIDGAEQPDTSVEAMAERYLALLRAVQPEGPYRLGGYCFGGLVAYEMACRLVAQGEAVAHLAIFEGYAPLGPGGRAIWRRPREWLNFARNLPYWIGDYIEQGGTESWSAVRRRARMTGNRVLRRFGRKKPVTSTDILGDQMQTIPTHARRMFETQIQAQIRYKPQPYPGVVTLYRVKRLSLLRAGDPLMGWANLALGGVNVCMVAGSHRNILEEPHVTSLASRLEAALVES